MTDGPAETSQVSTLRDSIAAKVLFGLMLLAPMVWLAGYLFPPINHDTAAVLTFSSRWLDGERLYIDLIDVNLPIVFIVYAIPEVLARLLHTSTTNMLTICLIAGILWSFLASRKILSLIPVASPPITREVLPAMMLFIMSVLPGENFGQREHVMLIATLPYLVAAGARAEGAALPRRILLLTASVAAIGFSLKPHFLGMPALVELYVLFVLGRPALRQPVPWVMGAVFLATALFTLLATPAYVTNMLPIIFDAYTQIGSDSSFLSVLISRYVGPTLAAQMVFGAIVFLLPRARLARVIVFYTAGAALSCIVQGKGWAYQSLPAVATALLLAATVVSQAIDRHFRMSGHQRLPVAEITVGFMLLFYVQEAMIDPPFRKQADFEESQVGYLARLIRREADNGKVLALSPGIYPIFPAVNYANAKMASRFMTMWVIQGVYADCEELAALYHPVDAMSPAEDYAFRAVAEDFARSKPSLLIVDRIAGVPRCQASTFDYLEYFLRNPLFARTFAHYEPLLEYERYVIYKRIPKAS